MTHQSYIEMRYHQVMTAARYIDRKEDKRVQKAKNTAIVAFGFIIIWMAIWF